MGSLPSVSEGLSNSKGSSQASGDEPSCTPLPQECAAHSLASQLLPVFVTESQRNLEETQRRNSPKNALHPQALLIPTGHDPNCPDDGKQIEVR